MLKAVDIINKQLPANTKKESFHGIWYCLCFQTFYGCAINLKSMCLVMLPFHRDA
jgi:hypothetical protein